MQFKINLRNVVKKTINYNSLRNFLICCLAFFLILWIMSLTLTFFHNTETVEHILPGIVFCGGDYVDGDYVFFEKEYYDNVVVRYVEGIAQDPEYENYYTDQHIGKVSNIEDYGAVQIETYSTSLITSELVFSGLYTVEEEMVCGKIYWNIDSVLFHGLLFFCISLFYFVLIRIIKR
jgi:hypothetical protein